MIRDRTSHPAFIFVAVLVGWSAFDLACVAMSGESYLLPRLLWGYGVAILLSALVGWICAVDGRLFWLALTLVVAAAVGTKFVSVDWPWHLICLPRALALLGLAVWAARFLGRGSGQPFLIAAGLGGIAAAVFAVYLNGSSLTPLTAASAGALLVLSSLILPMRWRSAAGAAIMLSLLGAVAVATHQSASPPRPNQQLAADAPDGGSHPNVVLIVLDTVSAHHLAPYGYSRVTTPGLDAFVRANALQYRQARSVSSWTLPSHASMFTGLHPSEHGADHPRDRDSDDPRTTAEALGLEPAEPMRHDVATLAERLAAAGYQTGAIVANCGYLSHAFGVDRGFEHYDDRPAFALMLLPQMAGFYGDLRKGSSRRGETITNLGIDWLDAQERRRPFFLFLNYMDAHAPYVPPTPYDSLFDAHVPSGDDRSTSSLLYDRELAYLDAHVTRFLGTLESKGLLQDTVVVITADHGEAFGQHGLWNHDKALYEPLIRVPLYVKSFGPPKPGVSDRSLSSPDLYHLILAEVGLGDAVQDDDTSLVAEWYRSPQMAARAVARGEASGSLDRDLAVWFDAGLKWIVSSTGEVEAYDLSLDPGETKPVQLSPAQIEHARARARAWWEAHPPLPSAKRGPATLDPAVMDRLRSLGYVH